MDNLTLRIYHRSPAWLALRVIRALNKLNGPMMGLMGALFTISLLMMFFNVIGAFAFGLATIVGVFSPLVKTNGHAGLILIMQCVGVAVALALLSAVAHYTRIFSGNVLHVLEEHLKDRLIASRNADALQELGDEANYRSGRHRVSSDTPRSTLVHLLANTQRLDLQTKRRLLDGYDLAEELDARHEFLNLQRGAP